MRGGELLVGVLLLCPFFYRLFGLEKRHLHPTVKIRRSLTRGFDAEKIGLRITGGDERLNAV